MEHNVAERSEEANLLTNYFRKALCLNDDDEQDAGPGPAVKKKAKKRGGKKEARATLKKEPKASSSNASSRKSVIPQQNAPITKKEVKAVLEELGPVTVLQIVKYFMPRLNSDEEKENFKVILTKIAHVRKRESGVAYVFLNSSRKSVIPQQNAPITKKEVKAVLEELGPVTVQQIVKYFKPRLNSDEEKENFEVILTKIAHLRKRESGVAYVFLNSSRKSVIPQQNAPITKKEVKAVLEVLGPVTVQQIVKYFKPRLNSAEEKKNFKVILTKIAHVRKRESGVAYVFLN